jgi:hypothetical protein
MQEFMASERRAVAARLADEHDAARADAHHRNNKVARAAMVAAEQRLAQADVARGLATLAVERQRCEHQYPLPSFDASAQQHEECFTFTFFLEYAERRREHVSEESRRHRGMVSCPPRWSDDSAGPSNAPPPPPIGRIESRRRWRGLR